MKLKIATSQFPVGADLKLNRDYTVSQMKMAKAEGCDIIHFCEGSLSGYVTVDFADFKDYDWDTLREYTWEIMDLAKDLGIWVILGSAHELPGNQKPFNCLYIINDKGDIVERYDKLFCTGDTSGKTEELAHFSSGNHFSTFEINGILCGTLICHDYRYPELYRELKKRGVQVMFHSFYAGNMSKERKKHMQDEVGAENFEFNSGTTYPEITMPATMTSYAANNYVWISCSNTSAKESCWASFMVRPDGVTVGRLEKNIKGNLITEIDTELEFYDSTKAWRDRAINGIYFSGEKVKDLRDRGRL